MSPKVHVELAYFEIGFCQSDRWRSISGPTRLAGNEIELGIGIPTIESRASNIPMTKGTTYVVLRFD